MCKIDAQQGLLEMTKAELFSYPQSRKAFFLLQIAARQKLACV